MGLQRLDDAELGRRTRERNTRANQVHRERLLNAGKRQTNVWLSAALRERLDALAMDQGAPLSEIAEQVLSAGLTALAAPSLPVTLSPPVEAKTAPESLPLFEPAPTENAPPLTCVNADQHSTVEGGSVKGEPAKPAPGTTAERDAAIVALRRQGKSLGQIAATLAEQGILTSKGNPLSRDTVNQVVKRAGLTKENAL